MIVPIEDMGALSRCSDRTCEACEATNWGMSTYAISATFRRIGFRVSTVLNGSGLTAICFVS